ncbi:ferritin-like domain-containing protein [Frankia sp. AgPm24]|uniref:ferroxidase n=2 Tax=Frankiaceae TaxID=74712 RepID=A0ABT0K459_9ACTN|nr:MULTISPECIES: ferritin-like domain-containing protein [Frankia]MCK9878570.1 ferritin-like domain-containing protein [Frankia umida]MCK9922620.1 ferritin-like domain-containing protein [Frankia sp. AgPm24]
MFVKLLNDDLSSEYQSIVQYIQHGATITGPQFLAVGEEIKRHLPQELNHATILAEQISFLGGTPTAEVSAVSSATDPEDALRTDLLLESEQLDRYRARVGQANDLGLADVAEALRPLLEQTQEHVRDLQSALGR